MGGLLRTAALCALLTGGAFAAGWFYRAHFDKATVAAAIAASNAQAAADVAKWRDVANRVETQYLQQKDLGDARNAALQAQLDKLQGGDALLSPYMVSTYKLLYPRAAQNGAPATPSAPSIGSRLLPRLHWPVAFDGTAIAAGNGG